MQPMHAPQMFFSHAKNCPFSPPVAFLQAAGASQMLSSFRRCRGRCPSLGGWAGACRRVLSMRKAWRAKCLKHLQTSGQHCPQLWANKRHMPQRWVHMIMPDAMHSLHACMSCVSCMLAWLQVHAPSKPLASHDSLPADTGGVRPWRAEAARVPD